MATKRAPFPEKLDTTGYRLYWNDTEVSEEEYKKLEQEAVEYNELIAKEKNELEHSFKKTRKKSFK